MGNRSASTTPRHEPISPNCWPMQDVCKTAVEWLREALRRDPRPPDWYYRNLAWAYYLSGRHDEALAMLQSQRNSKPTPLLAAVLLRLGQNAEARNVATEYRRAKPSLDVGRERHRPLAPRSQAEMGREISTPSALASSGPPAT